MQITPLFLVVCTCLDASWGVRRGKLTPYAHRYTKAPCANMHTNLHAHEINLSTMYAHKFVCIYSKHILLNRLRQSFRSSRAHEHVLMHNHAGSCNNIRSRRCRHVHNHKPTQACTQMLIYVCALSLLKSATLNRSISCNICASLSLEQRLYKDSFAK